MTDWMSVKTTNPQLTISCTKFESRNASWAKCFFHWEEIVQKITLRYERKAYFRVSCRSLTNDILRRSREERSVNLIFLPDVVLTSLLIVCARRTNTSVHDGLRDVNESRFHIKLWSLRTCTSILRTDVRFARSSCRRSHKTILSGRSDYPDNYNLNVMCHDRLSIDVAESSVYVYRCEVTANRRYKARRFTRHPRRSRPLSYILDQRRTSWRPRQRSDAQ